MTTLHTFTAEYLARTRYTSPEQVLGFLEQYRLIQARGEGSQKSKLISLKVPEELLESFRTRCELKGLKYQTQIKQLMKDWLGTL